MTEAYADLVRELQAAWLVGAAEAKRAKRWRLKSRCERNAKACARWLDEHPCRHVGPDAIVCVRPLGHRSAHANVPEGPVSIDARVWGEIGLRRAVA
ncbi:MAG: hypothetical protein EPN91_10740 [Salinibacterium sp.]|nr:MAG: hypothetical protein EPN91_10740 [Salinibacterium sp.]